MKESVIQIESRILTHDGDVYNLIGKPVKDAIPMGGLQVLALMFGHCQAECAVVVRKLRVFGLTTIIRLPVTE
jgi:hypothetical protein